VSAKGFEPLTVPIKIGMLYFLAVNNFEW